jgi:zinc protease
MKFRSILSVMLVAVSFTLAQAQQMQVPSIPVDTAVRIGKLPNGLTYYIRHNNYPEHRANFYIAQRVGSIQENDDQRGLAHFLEHMAFNGSEHFKGNALIEYTRSLGLSFGGDLNAETSVDRTVYNVCSVPTTRRSALDSCLLILKDWSNGLSLETSEIVKERGVIHEEWRLDSSPMQRMLERNIEAIYPGSKYGKRMPIGKMEIIDNFAPKVLRDYYHKWYRPDNQGIIIVGDIDVNYFEAQVKKLFGGIQVPANAAKVVDEPVPDNNEPIIIVDKDKEQSVNLVEVNFKHDVIPDSVKTSQIYLVEQFAKNMVTTMLNKRFDEQSQDPNCPYINAQCDDGQFIFAKTKDAFSVYVVPKDGKMDDAVKSAVSEALRAAKFGFTETEYARAKAEYLSQLEQRYTNRSTISSTDYCNQYVSNFLGKEPIPSITDEYQIMNQYVPAIPVAVVNQMASQFISKSDTNLVVLNFNIEKAGATYPTAQQLKADIDAAQTMELTPYVDNVKNEPLIKTLPAKGSIKGETEHAQLGYKELTLSNGAKVILKKTDFKQDEVTMTAFSKGGESLYGPKDYSNLKMFNYAVMYSGLGDFSKTELDKQLAGKQASANLVIDKTIEEVKGASTVKDLETMFQLTYLNFTGIKKDEKSYDNMLNSLKVSLKNKSMSPEQTFNDSVIATLHNHDARYTSLDTTVLNEVNYDRILEIAKERTADAGDFTFVFVGNFDENVIRPLIEQYIASLPSTGKKENWVNVASYPKSNVENDFTRKMETPKANAYMFWLNTSMPYSQENAIKANVAGEILNTIYLRKVREEQSAAYTIGAAGYSQHVGDVISTMFVGACPMKPEKADIALKIMREEVPAMAKSVAAEDLNKVKEYLLKEADTQARENDHWQDVLQHFMLYGDDIQTNYKKIVTSLTPADISKFVGDVVKGCRTIDIVMMPEK